MSDFHWAGQQLATTHLAEQKTKKNQLLHAQLS